MAASNVAIMAVSVLIVLAIVFSSIRRWRRGLGPPIKMPAWTASGRARTNAAFAKHGWANPYDDQGRLLPDSERQPPRSK